MQFERVLEPDYPCVYETWEVNGATWVVQDIPPEDFDELIDLFESHFWNEELVHVHSGIMKCPESLAITKHLYRALLSRRMSIAAYEIKDGKKTMASANVCFVKVKNHRVDMKPTTAAFKNSFYTLDYVAQKCDVFEVLGVDKVLSAAGLVVAKKYRGNRLGGKVLDARKKLCKSQGIPAAAHLYSSVLAYKLAEKLGYRSICDTSMKELAEHGLNYPMDDSVVFKVLALKFE